MKGQLIIGKHYSFYNINNNLIKVVIRGNNNIVVNPHKIIELIVNGNHNNIDIVRGGKINNIRVYGNNNVIAIKNNSHSNFFDQGINNSIFRDNNNPFLMPRHVPIFFNNNNNNFNRVRHSIYPPIFNEQNIEVDNIMDKLEEYNYFYLPQELKTENALCLICREAFGGNQRITIFSCKKHIFHYNCLKDHIKNNIDNIKCPTCNQSFDANDNISNDMDSPISLNINAPPLNPRQYFLRRNPNMQMRPRNENVNRISNEITLSDRVRNLLQRLGEINSHLNKSKKGLDKNIIDNMEISIIKDVEKLDADKKKCIICLEEYVNGDNSIALPCIHIFHANCIKTWLKDNNSCPICKNEIKYENEELDVNGEFQ